MIQMASGSESWVYFYTADDERIWSYDMARNLSHWTVRDLGGRCRPRLVEMLRRKLRSVRFGKRLWLIVIMLLAERKLDGSASPMRTSYSRGAIMLISGLLLLPGCYKAKKSSASPLQPDVTHAVNVDEIWRKNEKIVDNALSGRGYSVEEFGRACDFFEKTTGIEIRGNGSFFGWLANGDTAEWKQPSD